MDKKEKKYRLFHPERFKEDVADVLHTKYSAKHPYSKQEEQSRQNQQVAKSKVAGSNPDSVNEPYEEDNNFNEYDGDYNPQFPPQKDIWIGYGAVACLLLILSGTTIVNIKKGGLDFTGRNMASVDENQIIEEREILEDLNAGRRDLSSLDEDDLIEKEIFELDVLENYYVSYDQQGFVSEIQLRPEVAPIYIQDISQFINQHRNFFPPFENFKKINGSFDETESANVYHYRLEDKDDQSDFVFRMNQENELLSVVMENTGR